MSTITANYHFQPKDPSRSATGLVVVVGLHIVIGYALVSGLARDIVKVIKKPLDAAVIQEVKLPPPPPPPKVVKVEQAPKVKAPPPPAYVPPPEVVAPVSAPVIAASTPTPPPEPAVIAPPAPPAPVAPPKPQRMDIAASCPNQVRPEVPRGAEGVSGVIRAQAVIRDGIVKEVTILSGPKVFHSAVRSAMLQYRCVSGDADIVAVQQFVFEAG
ncbi:MAG TPA: energy transducer TonB [Zoogloea sp.]|jgi:protein TonB|uniref:energy transducer TonB n=1 Tax=Zoogloea sp. TaxID=49181 RepID=UPI002C0FB630|nr:energy transducer TonB [Zoogloea sp.]